MKTLTRFSLTILALCGLLATSLIAGPLDGKWTGAMKVPATKKQEARDVPVTLQLTADGETVKGTVSASRGRKAAPLEIQDGKIIGNKVSFTTVTKTKKGDQTTYWEGTVEGSELKMIRKGKGRQANAEATLKRAG
ncbi:MAG: hypothetical protein JJE04_13940 [Acidobacteriia bacterium]|nr:hypothetical protein [Terriglobia bacterium]